MSQNSAEQYDEAEKRFFIARGRAIQSYAMLESDLCVLFTSLLETRQDLAGIVFFKITSARYRNLIVEKLIKRHYGSEYNHFWNSIKKLLVKADQRRNEIVHWTEVGTSQRGFHEIGLSPPNWMTMSSSPTLTEVELDEFCELCSVLCRAVTAFNYVVLGNVDYGGRREEYLNIFHQALDYPLQDGHLLKPEFIAGRRV